MKRMISFAAILLTSALSTTAVAQGPDHLIYMPQAAASGTGDVVYMQGEAGATATSGVVVHRKFASEGGIFPPITIGGTEFLFEGRVVKGAPFSAEAITETVQLLADGNRIVNNSSTRIFRDSEGRTRRELGQDAQAMTVLPFPGTRMSRPEVMISDPVAGANYMLDLDNRTAQKLPLPQRVQFGHIASPNKNGVTIKTFSMNEGRPAAGTIAFGTPDGNTKTESLGTQTIEGLEARGERVTTTIPAGKIGNELPIISTNESWFSPKLQRVILSKRHDPRFGDTTFRLTNVDQSEPASSLFQVPSDFTVTDPRTEMERFKKDMEGFKKEMEQMKKTLPKHE